MRASRLNRATTSGSTVSISCRNLMVESGACSAGNRFAVFVDGLVLGAGRAVPADEDPRRCPESAPAARQAGPDF